MSGVLGIGSSALLAFQRALATTGHNIANATTEGYSRQRVQFTSRPPQQFGGNFFGTGVQVGDVSRIADVFVEAQLRSATSGNAQFSTFYDYARRVDNLLADVDSGLSPGLQKFFSAVQDVANDPTSTAARQVLISEAESLVDRFRSLDQRLSEQRGLVNSQISSTVDEINSLARAIARVNEDVVTGLGRGAVPNDLLDQRDALVRELAERIDVTVTDQDDGALNVFIGTGQNLVLGSRVSTLVAQPLSEDPSEIRIGFAEGKDAQAQVDISRFLTGGRLGALLDVRSQVLDTAQNSLGRTAVALAEAFNEQHRMGQDLDGFIGQDFFNVPKPQVLSSRAGLQGPEVTFGDIDRLGTGDFRLVAVDDGAGGLDWQLRREPGGRGVDDGDGPLGSSVGLNINTDTIGTDPAPQVGDSFLIRPTRLAARTIDTVIDDPRSVAAAKPMITVEGPENGPAAIARFEPTGVNPVNGLSAPAPVVVDDDDGLTVDSPWDPVRNADGNLIGAELTISNEGIWFLEFETEPQDGDTFTLTLDRAGPGDNSNALALGELQGERLLDGGNATLEGSYNTLIAEVGTRTRQAEIGARAQESLLRQAQEQRESISGVNLDEEAANLLRYQQAYQAAAQVISVTSTIFDTLINAVRR